MRRPAAAMGLILAITLAVTPAGTALAATDDNALAAAVKSVLAGQHVYASPGAAAINQKALTAEIGAKPIWVIARASSGSATSDWLAEIATQTRSNGTYVLLDGTALTATSNTIPQAGVDVVRAAAVKAHPKNPSAALDELVQKLVSGAAATAAPSGAASRTATNTAPDKAAGNSASKSSSVSPLLLVLLVPILGGVAFAVTRARRRTG